MSSSRAFSSSNWRVKDTKVVAPSETPPAPLGPNSVIRKIIPEREQPKPRDQPKHSNSYDEQECMELEEPRLYVGNMLYIANRQDVALLFSEAGYVVVNIDISMDLFTGRNPSYCFVDLDSITAAQSAARILNGKDLLGRQLKIRPSTKKRVPLNPKSEGLVASRWKREPIQQDTVSDLANATSYTFPSELLDPLEGLRRLYVGGLPKPADQHTSDAEIQHLFKEFDVQAVSKVKSPHESTKSKPGNHFYAFVDFGSKEDAQAAIKAVNGKLAFDGRLRVNIATSVPRKVFERSKYEQLTKGRNE